MRTTVTLDADVVAALQRAARERGSSFKAVLNDAVRRGLGSEANPAAYRTPTRDMGLRTGIDIDKALELAAADEDAETMQPHQRRSPGCPRDRARCRIVLDRC